MAGNGAAPAEPADIAAVLEGLAADREAAASGAAAGPDEPDAAAATEQEQPADGERLRSAAEAAMQRGDRVFAFPTGSACLHREHCLALPGSELLMQWLRRGRVDVQPALFGRSRLDVWPELHGLLAGCRCCGGGQAQPAAVQPVVGPRTSWQPADREGWLQQLAAHRGAAHEVHPTSCILQSQDSEVRPLTGRRD